MTTSKISARVRAQSEFTRDVMRLLAMAFNAGFTVTLGEAFRTPEQQAIHVKAGRSKTMSSNHLDRRALDLNFFLEDGTLCYDKDTLQPLGDFWESLHPNNRWGGNWKSFKDVPHFERHSVPRT